LIPLAFNSAAIWRRDAPPARICSTTGNTFSAWASARALTSGAVETGHSEPKLRISGRERLLNAAQQTLIKNSAMTELRMVWMAPASPGVAMRHSAVAMNRL